MVAIAALKQLGLVQDLLGVLHELPAIFGQASPFFAPDKEAREKFARGEISQAELTAVEDQEIKNLVQKEVAAGLKVVSDGEFRRSYWHLDTFWGFGGVEHVRAEHGYFFYDEETRPDAAKLVGKLTYEAGHPDVAAFDFLKPLADAAGVEARQSIPAPAQLYCELICRNDELIAANDAVYPDRAELANDVSKVYRELILDLYKHGARDIKLDDCTWGVLVNDSFWHAFDEGHLKREEILQLYKEINENALVDLPEDLRITTHICRGNYDSTWASEGGYGPAAPYVLMSSRKKGWRPSTWNLTMTGQATSLL
ncbi:hypothetical protein ME792_09860 [Lactobacillus delbrueckii]|nr:hypothetical protein ME792_09860 [Lactobacillus delbrueckii]